MSRAGQSIRKGRLWQMTIAGGLIVVAGCKQSSPIDEIGKAVCQGSVRVPTSSALLDVGVLQIAAPNGYKLSAGNSHHGGIQLWQGQRMIGISNGLWSGSSFRAHYERQSPEPICRLVSNGIPVTVYSMSGEDGGYGPGHTLIGAIVEYPARPVGEKIMQPLVNAVIADGDIEHAIAVRRLIDSIRKGTSSDEVILPASEAKKVSR